MSFENAKESPKDVFDHQESRTLLMFFDFSKIDDTSPTAYNEVEQKLFAEELACASNSSDLDQNRRQEEEDEEEREEERGRGEDNHLNTFEPENDFETQYRSWPSADEILSLLDEISDDDNISSNCDQSRLRGRIDVNPNRISSSPSDQNYRDDDDDSLHLPRIPVLPPSHDLIPSLPLHLNLSDSDDDYVPIRARSLRRRTVHRLESNSTFSYAAENSYYSDIRNIREVRHLLRRSNTHISDSNPIFSPAAENSYNGDPSNYDPIRNIREVRHLLRRSNTHISDSNPIFSPAAESSDDEDDSSNLLRNRLLHYDHMPVSRFFQHSHNDISTNDDRTRQILRNCLRRNTEFIPDSDRTSIPPLEQNSHNYANSSNYDAIRKSEVLPLLRRSNTYISDSNSIFLPEAESSDDDDSSNLLRNRLSSNLLRNRLLYILVEHMPTSCFVRHSHNYISTNDQQILRSWIKRHIQEILDSDRTSSPPLEQNSQNDDNSLNFDSSSPLEQNSRDDYYSRVRNLLMSYPWGNDHAPYYTDISSVSEKESEKEEEKNFSISLEEERNFSISFRESYSDALLQLINPLIVELNSYNEIDDGSKENDNQEEDNSLSDRVFDIPSMFTKNSHHKKCALSHFIFNLIVAGGKKEDVVTLLTELRKRFSDGPCFEQINSWLLKFIPINNGNDREEDDKEEEQNHQFKSLTLLMRDRKTSQPNEDGNMENTKVEENNHRSKKLNQWI